jgi:hypothetical protein
VSIGLRPSLVETAASANGRKRTAASAKKDALTTPAQYSKTCVICVIASAPYEKSGCGGSRRRICVSLCVMSVNSRPRGESDSDVPIVNSAIRRSDKRLILRFTNVPKAASFDGEEIEPRITRITRIFRTKSYPCRSVPSVVSNRLLMVEFGRGRRSRTRVTSSLACGRSSSACGFPMQPARTPGHQ